MLKSKPYSVYCGLTVILSNPSRFDKFNLLSAGGGHIFDAAIRPEYNRHQCEIRLKEDISPLLPHTKCLLILGEPATKLWLKQSESNSLGEIRGSLFTYDGRHTNQHGLEIPVICSFFPQDCADIKDYEGEFNRQEDEVSIEGGADDNEDGESDVDSKRRHGRTKRRNYKFWLNSDIQKVKYILKHEQAPNPLFKPKYIIQPKSSEVISVLRETKNANLFIDLETFFPSCDIKCNGFSFDCGNPIYIFPVYDWRNNLAYSNVPELFRALAIAIRDNNTIAHNGAGFDFFVLAWKYHIALGKHCEDTMIMMHRFYSDIERSLGHITSLFTWEPFHKDEGNVGYSNPQQMKQTMEYCGKDVYTMQLAYYEMKEKAKKIPGLQESFDMANRAIRPYLITSLLGINYREEMLNEIVKENDRLMMQYLRWLEILIGKDMLDEIRGKGKSSMPSSNKQCVKYFHELLGYAIVGKGKETKDGTKNPSLGKKNLYKLRLKYNNPVIDICLAYRELAKESSSLKFIPWQFKQETKQETNDNRSNTITTDKQICS